MRSIRLCLFKLLGLALLHVGGAARATQSGGTQNVKLSRTQIGLVVPRFLLKRRSGAEGLVQPDILVPDDLFPAATAIEALLCL